MGVDIADLVMKVSADTTGATKNVSDLNEHVSKSGGFFSGASDKLKGFIGGALAVGGVTLGFGALKDTLGDMVSAGMQANKMTALLAQGLRSTHDASGQTLNSLDALSTHIMGLTGIQDDAVQGAEQMLLTFTNIKGNVFPGATQAVADLATRLNNGLTPSAQQMSQVALQLGKALNDPMKGVTELTRVGVTFTAQQKDQIAQMTKSGNVAGAQAVILKELQKEFGGSAEAAGHANGGMAILNATLDNAKQQIGQALIPAISSLTATFEPLFIQVAQHIAPAITQLSGYLKSHKEVLTAVAIVAGGVLVAAFVAWAVSAGAAAVATIAATWPVLAIMAAIGGLIGLLVLAYNHWGFFRTVVNAARMELGIIFQFIGNVIGVLGNLAGKVGQAKDRFGDFLGVLGHIKDMIGNLLGLIGNLIGKLGSIHLPNLGGIHLPGFAVGGTTPGGPILVGESGPEILVPPAGSQVYPLTNEVSHAAAAAGAGVGPVTITFQVDSRELSRIVLKRMPEQVMLYTGSRS